jgi:hypothetical protein
MLDRFGEAISVVLGALALAYLVYEIDRRKRKLRDLFHVLDGGEADISADLLNIVESGELQPYFREIRA